MASFLIKLDSKSPEDEQLELETAKNSSKDWASAQPQLVFVFAMLYIW